MTDGFERLRAALADRYQLERELGQGGMATVYLALDLKHQRRVAVKVLRAELAATLGPERFLREITIAANLQHPHILPLHDSGVADGFLYYVMPFVEGESLRQKVAREGELPVAEAVRILRDLADALAHAHKRGVVHRDIKPENVMLSERHALVTDFGVAKAVSVATGTPTLTTAGVALGTPAYMAPEQAAADSHTDHRADIYALGIVAYELLTGRPPFMGATPQAILGAHVTTAPDAVTKYRANIPPALASLVMQCLEKKAADRPQSAESLIPVLEAALTPSGGMTPTETRPIGAAPAIGSPSKRAWLGLAVVVAVALGLALWRNPGAVRPAANASPKSKSIAVLPLVNVGGDSTQDYYADGISEELTNALGKVPGLRVAARTSSFAFKGRRDLDVAEVGEKLNVAVVLQGTVRRVGDSVRLSVQLTDTQDRVELWSDSYDQALKDVFAMQDSITRAIVSQLALSLGAAGRGTRAENPEAHDLYLRGLELANGAEGDLRQALIYYRRALSLDRDYVDAWLGLAYAHAQLADAYESGRAAFDSTRAAAREVLARDSLAGDAHMYLGWVAMAVDWNFVEGDRVMFRAITLSPNSPLAHMAYGVTMCPTRVASALVEIDRAIDLDRLNPFLHWARAWCLYGGRRYEDAIAQDAKNRDLGPFLYIDDFAAASARELGLYPEALRRYLESQKHSEQPLSGLAITYARMGRIAEAREVLARLVDYAKAHYVNPMFFAAIHTSLGETDLAFEWLERAATDRTSWLTWLHGWPELDPLKSDPRFAALVKRMGLPEVSTR